MKTIQILKTLINILFYVLIAVLAVGLLFCILLWFFPDLLPIPIRGFRLLFNGIPSWKLFLAPLSTVINCVLLIVATYYLKKSVESFIRLDYYTNAVTNNLKNAGNLFLFIGVSSIVLQLFTILYVQHFANQMVHIKTNFLIILSNIIAATVDLKSILSIITGLFFLLFSKIFENSRALKQENDLTI